MIPLTSHMKYSPEVAPNSFDFRRFEGDIPKPSTESVITPPKLLDETSLKGDTSNTNFRFSNATNPVLLVISSDEACSLAARFFCTKLVAYMRWCGESVKLFVASNDFNSPELTRYTHDSEEWLRQVRRCIDSSMEYYDSDPPLGFAATPVSVICADCLSAGSLAAFHELLPPERSFYIRHISFTEEVAAEAIEGCGYIDVCLPRQMLRASRCRGSVICSSVTSFLNNVLPSLYRIYRHEPLDGLPTDTLRSFAPVFFIRHGQSEYNLEDRLGGDPDLTDSGRQDAADIAEFFQQQVLTNEHLFSDRNEVWNREVGFEVRCSQLRRTRHTAAPSAAVLSTHPKTFKSLNEIHAGICEDMTNEEVKVLYPHIQSFRHSDKVGFRYPNGESYRDLARRLTPLLLDLTNTKEAVLVVAHQAVLRTVLSYFGGPPVEEAVHGPCPQRTIWACTYNRIGEPQLAEIALPPRRNKTGPTDAPAINWTGW